MDTKQTGRTKDTGKSQSLVETAAVKIEDIVQSNAYEKAMQQAGLLATSGIMVLTLLGKVSKRLKWMAPTAVLFVALRDDLTTIIRMLRAYYDGTYKHLPLGTVVKLLGAVLYFSFSLDFIPDFIPVIGFLDDALVMSLVIKSVQSDVEDFKKWENEQPLAINA